MVSNMSPQIILNTSTEVCEGVENSDLLKGVKWLHHPSLAAKNPSVKPWINTIDGKYQDTRQQRTQTSSTPAPNGFWSCAARDKLRQVNNEPMRSTSLSQLSKNKQKKLLCLVEERVALFLQNMGEKEPNRRPWGGSEVPAETRGQKKKIPADSNP